MHGWPGSRRPTVDVYPVVFPDGNGAHIGSPQVDYTLPVARSHVLFKRKPGVRYVSVQARLRDGTTKLTDVTLKLPEVTEAARFAATREKAVVLAGVSDVVMAFLPDLVRNDGSYDLMLGCPPSAPSTSLRLIRDFIAPREDVVGELGRPSA